LSPRPEILLLQAEIFSEIGEVGRADRLLQRYLKFLPQDPQALFLTGKHALNRSDYETARQSFQVALTAINSSFQEHDSLKATLELYLEFAGIYSERDDLFDRDLIASRCMEEIQGLLRRALDLRAKIRSSAEKSGEGMSFFLDHEIKIFEQWLLEMEHKA